MCNIIFEKAKSRGGTITERVLIKGNLCFLINFLFSQSTTKI